MSGILWKAHRLDRWKEVVEMFVEVEQEDQVALGALNAGRR